MEWGRGWKEELGVQGGVAALTCPSHPFTLGASLSPQGFSVQGQYGAVTPAEVSVLSHRHPCLKQPSSNL